MSIIILWASPNNNGLTAECCAAAVRAAVSCNVGCNNINLNKLIIERCQVCGDGYGSCIEGRCCVDDDFGSVYEKLAAADGIVLITPVYWHDMAEPVKVFFDRLRRCDVKANHFLKNKRCITVAAAGGSGRGGIKCLMSMENILNHMEVNIKDELSITRYSRDYMIASIEKSVVRLCEIC